MSKRTCAHNNITASPKPRSERIVPNKGTFFFALAIVLITLFPVFSVSAAGEKDAASTSPAPSSTSGGAKPETDAAVPPSPKATTQIIVSVTINMESKGDFFVELDNERNLFIREEDLKALKLKYAEGRTVLIGNEQYVPLSAVLDVTYNFDEKSLTVAIIGKTTEVQKTSVDLFSLKSTPQNVYYPRETSAFLNYGLTYSYSSTDGFQSFTAINKVGVSSGNIFFTSDSQYTKTEQSASFVRLQSSATYERWGDLQWLVLGDQFANSGDLGSTVNMGGIGFSKVYKLDPYLITQPVMDLKGTVTLPTQAEIYLDGTLVGKQPIAPGSFELKNLYSYTGAHNIDLVLRDPFGNIQRISYPAYFSTQLLREGLHEYSYNVGFLREQYGVESNDYGKAVFSAFHRYGLTNAVNIGARAEGGDGVYNGGISTAFLVPRVGQFALSLAGSSANGNKGSAGSFQYSYQLGSFNTNVLLRGYSRDYATISSVVSDSTDSTSSTKYEENLGMGFMVDPLGSFSLNYASSETYDGVSTRTTAANYSRVLSRITSLFATASTTQSSSYSNKINAVFIGLNINFDWNLRGSVQYNHSGDTNSETVQLQKDTPVGEGLGYRLSLNQNETGSTNTKSFSPFIQYNARYGVLTLDSSIQNSAGVTSELYNLSVAGSFVYTGGFTGISRPVSDSFSIVMADKLQGAAVSNNGQEIGKTDSSGTLIVPTLTSYNRNQITLDTKNIPIDYSISDVNRTLTPSLWSGSCVFFDARKVRALIGTLFVQSDDKKTPLEYIDIMLKVGEKEVAFPTGKGGEFYLENSLPEEAKTSSVDNLSCREIAERKKTGGNMINPGTYSARVDYEGGTCAFSITFPETEDMLTDVGEVVCKPLKAPAPPRAGVAPQPVTVMPAAPAVPATPIVRPAAPAVSAAPAEAKKKIPESAAVTETVVIKANFDKKGAPVTSKDRKALEYVVRLLRDHPELSVEIEGHGDRHGSEAATVRIGMKRAEAVKTYLLRSGVKLQQIRKVESLGRKQMVCTEATTVCDRLNRRVVVRAVRSNVEAVPTPLQNDKGAPGR
ncbi:MAG TPA: fimbria/pilus outer membrane usher protein [Nitrospirota bacterium]|nr:fimbria/pilus outer membrane usher protein [Nitrospirota bacterium]